MERRRLEFDINLLSPFVQSQYWPILKNDSNQVVTNVNIGSNQSVFIIVNYCKQLQEFMMNEPWILSSGQKLSSSKEWAIQLIEDCQRGNHQSTDHLLQKFGVLMCEAVMKHKCPGEINEVHDLLLYLAAKFREEQYLDAILELRKHAALVVSHEEAHDDIQIVDPVMAGLSNTFGSKIDSCIPEDVFDEPIIACDISEHVLGELELCTQYFVDNKLDATKAYQWFRLSPGRNEFQAAQQMGIEKYLQSSDVDPIVVGRYLKVLLKNISGGLLPKIFQHAIIKICSSKLHEAKLNDQLAFLLNSLPSRVKVINLLKSIVSRILSAHPSIDPSMIAVVIPYESDNLVIENIEQAKMLSNQVAATKKHFDTWMPIWGSLLNSKQTLIAA